MMYEFEVYEDESDPGWLLAVPFDFGGGTSGRSWEEIDRMTCDFLRTVLEDCHIRHEEYPKATFGNMPRHANGRIVIVACDDPARTIRKTTPSDAARILGVSPARVSQLIGDCALEAFTDTFGKRWVTMASIEARLAENPGPGRPSAQQASARQAPREGLSIAKEALAI